MKRTVPLLITAIAGFVLIISFFLPAIKEWGEVAAVWFDILASIAFILGGGNLMKLHLKAISDKESGWGYSAVTLVAFLVTLAFGLFKFGSPPSSSVEFYGETFVEFPINAMPEYRVPGSIPERADEEPIPASVRRQLREEGDQLVFQGWMSADQRNDLFDYKETLEWQAQIERLHEAAQPPGILKSKILFRADHSALSVKGVLNDEMESALSETLPESEIAQRAIDELKKRSNRQTTIQVADVPEEFEIPEEFQSVLTLEQNKLTLIGPIRNGSGPGSIPSRTDIINQWSGFEPALPLTPDQEAELKAEIESLGEKLTEEQNSVFEKYFAGEWDAQSLIAAINTAGIPPDRPKSKVELLEERNAGVENLKPNHPAEPPTLLTDAQKQIITTFIQEPGQSIAELKDQLDEAGELTDAQSDAVTSFIEQLPRRAEELKALGLKLVAAGPLSAEQREYLFQPAAELYAWETEVNKLFQASHQMKYPWSGDYSAEGNPFWWVYEYVLQPLMTTTFAVLAFYVASAAFRAFRAKNIEATLLLGTAFIVLLGRTYLGVQLTAWVPDALSAFKIDQMIVYIMKIFNTAGNRAIMIGIALGIASTSLKVLLGIDRSYLGSGDD